MSIYYVMITGNDVISDYEVFRDAVSLEIYKHRNLLFRYDEVIIVSDEVLNNFVLRFTEEFNFRFEDFCSMENDIQPNMVISFKELKPNVEVSD